VLGVSSSPNVLPCLHAQGHLFAWHSMVCILCAEIWMLNVRWVRNGTYVQVVLYDLFYVLVLCVRFRSYVEQSSKTNNILTVMYTITKWLWSDTTRFELVVFCRFWQPVLSKVWFLTQTEQNQPNICLTNIYSNFLTCLLDIPTASTKIILTTLIQKYRTSNHSDTKIKTTPAQWNNTFARR